MCKRCECGKLKDPASDVCRGCYIAKMRAMKSGKKIGGAKPTVRQCNACLEKFDCYTNSKQKSCARCQKMLLSIHSLEKVIENNIAACDDLNRKMALEDLLTQHNDIEGKIDASIQCVLIRDKIADLNNSMKCVKKQVYSNGRKTTKKLWRCGGCGALCLKRKCVYCEVRIRGNIK